MHVKVRATADARKERIERVDETTFEIAVKEPRERNLANRRIAELLAKEYGVDTKKVRLIRGRQSQGKMFDIAL